MAEILSPVIEKLFELLSEEVKSLKGVHKGIEMLKKELIIIQAFLKDADSRLERGDDKSETLKTWVKQVREEAYNIEDVIDEYLCYVVRHRHHDQRKFMRCFHKIGGLIKSLKRRRDIGSEIQNSNESLSKIKGIAETFGLRPLEQGSSSRSTVNVEENDLRLGSIFLEKDELVGIDSMLNELVGKLVEGTSMRSVISLVGEGGIGKTTLAKRVFDDEVVKRYFDCHAWIIVSQSYNLEKLLLDVKMQICPTVEYTTGEFSIRGLISHLREYLQTRRYIIVCDDVWQEEFWEVMKYAFPSNNKGGKIIITTRNHTIANFCKEAPSDVVQEIKTWSPEPAFELFCKKAFRYEFEGCCPKELEKLSRDIVSKCQGLPLVIAAVAGLLSTKEKVDFEWQRMLDNLNFRIDQNDPKLARISKILSLSYHDLPYHLKSCFLYFGIFPQDYQLFDLELYQMWIAEGFVKARKDLTLEQVAEEYLNELINRNMVGFVTDSNAMGYRKCQVHDLMHDVIVSKADELGFYQILDNKKSRSSVGKVRRLSIQGGADNVLETVEDSRVRSVFLFNFDVLTEPFLIGLFKKFKLLKVLHIESSNFPHDHNFPKEVGNLFHLKYLVLKFINVRSLPNSIGKLYNLQNLSFLNTSICELPVEINNLRNLRHLHVAFGDPNFYENPYRFNGLRIKEGIGKLENLQTLELVYVQPGGVRFFNELKSLVQLRMLSLAELTQEFGRDLCASIEKMKYLENLELISINSDEVLDLQYISSPLPNLKKLCLWGRLPMFFNWILELGNLQVLALYHSRLIELPLTRLKDLPNFAKLILSDAYNGAQLHFEGGGFRKLKDLYLTNLKELKVVKIDEGALPLLESLWIEDNPLMNEVPSDFQHLRNLKSLDVFDMSKEFVVRMQPNGGPDYFKIKHVPFVSINYTELNVGYKLGDPELLEYLEAAS